MSEWQAPKEDYSDRININPAVTKDDLNRIEGNINVLKPLCE